MGGAAEAELAEGGGGGRSRRLRDPLLVVAPTTPQAGAQIAALNSCHPLLALQAASAVAWDRHRGAPAAEPPDPMTGAATLVAGSYERFLFGFEFKEGAQVC